MADLTTDIETNAQGPKAAAGDGHSATAHSLPDQIMADEYLKANAANKTARRGLVIQKLKPPSAR